jgi:hypothetical protein
MLIDSAEVSGALYSIGVDYFKFFLHCAEQMAASAGFRRLMINRNVHNKRPKEFMSYVSAHAAGYMLDEPEISKVGGIKALAVLSPLNNGDNYLLGCRHYLETTSGAGEAPQRASCYTKVIK